MDRSLYLAMSGAKQDMYGMQLHANNLANVRTTGFRADLEQARSMQHTVKVCRHASSR